MSAGLFTVGLLSFGGVGALVLQLSNLALIKVQAISQLI